MRNVFSNGRDSRGAKTSARALRGALLRLAAWFSPQRLRRLPNTRAGGGKTPLKISTRARPRAWRCAVTAKLFLAPRFAEFADANLAYLLAIRADAKGNLYAAGGSNAKVLRMDAAAKSTSVFESSELAAQALAVDAAGNLFVGTSPDGKVYKVTPAGQSSVFFDPKTKYIWDLAVDKDGTVYVATGDTGKIFVRRAGRQGAGFLFQRGNAYPFAGARCERKRPGRHRAERAASCAFPRPRITAAPLSFTKLSKKEITALLQRRERKPLRRGGRRENSATPGPAAPQFDGQYRARQTFVISIGPGGKRANAAFRRRSHVPSRPLAHREFEFRVSNCSRWFAGRTVELAR